MTISVHIDARSGTIECLALYLVHSPRELWVQKALLYGNPQIENCLLSENHGDGRVCNSEIGETDDIGFRSHKILDPTMADCFHLIRIV